MTNPIIQTDIADLLRQINQKLDKIDDRLNKLEVGQVKLEGKVEAIDEKLSGQIKALDTKVDQIDKRIGNQEFLNRGIFGGIILIVLGVLPNYSAG
jgi:predicted  nucleic acid-binding Zn-ribbon protein